MHYGDAGPADAAVVAAVTAAAVVVGGLAAVVPAKEGNIAYRAGEGWVHVRMLLHVGS